MRQNRFLLWLLCCPMVVLAHLSAAIEIIGSDLLTENVRQAITDELAKNNIEVEFSLTGSLLAREAFDRKEIDACILAAPDHDEPLSYKNAFAFGFQIAAIAVHANNPLAELDYKQLGDIFRSSGSIDNWNSLLSDSEWQDRQINIWAARDKKIIALELFNSVALEGSPLKDSIRYDATDGEPIMRALENDISAVVLLPYMELNVEARFLAIKEDPDAQSYTPSKDNVFYGDYPLRLPFKLVLADDMDRSMVRNVLQAVYSDRVTDALVLSHYMPLPEQERQAVMDQLD